MYLLFDIGGTNTRVAVGTDAKNISKLVRFPTPQDFNQGVEQLIQTAQELAEGAVFTGIGGGIAGVWNKNAGRLDTSPHLKNWEYKPFGSILNDRLGAPAFIANDTNIIALGEAIYGAGQGQKIVAYIGIGTGVGGSRIINKIPDETAQGFEPGHHFISQKDTLVEWEQLISGSAIQAKTGKQPQDVHDPEFWREIANWTAIGLYNTLMYWSPDILVVGGGLINYDLIPFDILRHKLQSIQKVFDHTPAIAKATLGERGGIMGGLAYIHQNTHSNG